jgi:RimJ/RimL family protein N-acetyltransferase
VITGQHAVVRLADADDAPALHALYNPAAPRAALLDQRREPLWPTIGEIRELLTRKEATRGGSFYAVEDPQGVVHGFCSVRGMNQEAGFGELAFLLHEHALTTPLADEVFDFLHRRAFENLRLHKVMVHCLEEEGALRGFLLRHRFEPCGRQREVFFSRGKWHDVHVLSLHAPRFTHAATA